MTEQNEKKKGVHMVFGKDMTAKKIAKAIAEKAVELGLMTEEQAKK